MELTKDIATRGDIFSRKLLSVNNLQRQQVYDLFIDKNEATFVCDLLDKKNLIKLISPSDTDIFGVIEKKDGLSNFLENGGLTKIANDLEQKLRDKKEMEFLNKRLTELSIINVGLQNRKLKREIWIAIISFIVGAIMANLKDILTMLKIVMNQ